MRIRHFLLSLLTLATLTIFITPIPVLATSDAEYTGNVLKDDLHTLTLCRKGLNRSVGFARSRPDIFGADKKQRKGLLSRRDKLAIWTTWSALLDYVATLDELGSRYGNYSTITGKSRDRTTFSVRCCAFLTEYRYALEFISLAEKNPALDTILDEPVPELGLAGGSYARFKFRFLNIARATEFAAMETVDKGLAGPDASGLRKTLDEDAGVIWRMGKGRGPVLTLANGVAIVGKAGFAAWFPVQKGVSEWMGDVKVRHLGVSFISQEQIRELRPRLQPGDILLERREWYLSNLGLPGFWTHAALYIGTADERRAFFEDPDVKAWVKSLKEKNGDFESLLLTRYPSAYQISKAPQEGDHLPRVLEAISEGVSFTTIEHSAAADSLAVLRPRLSKREKAEAIVRAFHYSGRPYDFNFDFRTDSSLVCSELIFKVYEPAPGIRGLSFPLAEIMGRKVSLPNDMARQFSTQYGTAAQQTDLVVFLDGFEKSASASEADVAQFRRSWQRPKWHVLTQKSPEEPAEAKTGSPIPEAMP
jgi:hypothetical protein